MKTSDFYFELPEALIAQRPPEHRPGSRLLVLSADGVPRDYQFQDLPDFLHAGDLLVLNDTRVIPARLLGKKESGGRVEVLIERIEIDFEALAHIRASKACKPGTRLTLEDDLKVEVVERFDDLFRIRLLGEESFYNALERIGRIPLPPYIQRDADEEDRQRYQTVYAQSPGAVAAPTAGLHFDEQMLRHLEDKGIEIGRLTLHVGAGTFQPVRSENIESHRMHSERIVIDTRLASQIQQTRSRGGRVVAVGTTVVRALESVADETGQVSAYNGETDIFIRPGYRFRVIDAMITNFHLPESTLLMLVSAFAGTERILNAYQHAVAEKYRFFSYGDAMFIERTGESNQKEKS
ncbi:MAG: tRNA preQ1(34) S-adenosylmethionine ribosyltransferase-isomerase QueA [Acidiferrobacterales bacterium]